MELKQVEYSALNVTHNCNLRCSYCYTGPKQPKEMTLRTALQSVDFLTGQNDKGCTITLFGGEPLLEFDLIRSVVEYSQKTYGDRVAFRMSTNGTLITPEIMSFLQEHQIYFCLSLDGNQAQHDLCRRYSDDGGSYQDAISNLDMIFRFNPYTIAVSVVVPETAEHLAAGVIDLFDKGFRYVLQTLDYSAPWTSKSLKVLKEQYKRLAGYYSKCLKANKKIYYSPFDERIKTRAHKPYGPGDLCDLANSQIAIAPSGKIYPCVQFIGTDNGHFTENAIGSVFTGFETERREYFVTMNYADRKSCIGCALYGRCATYCGCVNWRATGDLRSIPTIICEHERMLMPIIDTMANKLWAQKISLFKRKFYEKSFPMSSYIEDCLAK
ncbi:radical SAM protein [Chloroflexota bacterium]